MKNSIPEIRTHDINAIVVCGVYTRPSGRPDCYTSLFARQEVFPFEAPVSTDRKRPGYVFGSTSGCSVPVESKIINT